MEKEIISLIVDKLLILREVYSDDAMPNMIDETDAETRIKQIDKLLKKLKTK